MFFHLLDLSIVNASILYNQVSSKQMSHLEFRLAVVKSLLEDHKPQTSNRQGAPNSELPLRLTERPFSEKIPKTTQWNGRLQCEVCRARGIKSQTQVRCKICQTPLHLHHCFEIYHTKLDYSKDYSKD